MKACTPTRKIGETTYKVYKGSRNFRQRLLLATLTSTPIIIKDIHANQMPPGIRSHEDSLVKLFMEVTDDFEIEYNETGTRLRYKPGKVMGGRNLEYDCGLSRSIVYFLEPLIVLSLFGKNPLSIRLKGITNDSKDPSVDTLISTAFPILKKFNVPGEGLRLKVLSRGVPPLGGGEVLLTVPIIQHLTAVNWIDQGLIENIKGVAFTTNVGISHGNKHSAKNIFNLLSPKYCYIHSDYSSRQQAGKYVPGNLKLFMEDLGAKCSPGYGISVYAESTSGCIYSADTTVSRPRKDETGYFDQNEKNELIPAADVGEQVASLLLEEIKRGGVVNSTHQGLLFLLCALCPPDVSNVRVGPLSPYGTDTMRNILEFLGVEFKFKPDPSTGTVLTRCVGCGMRNINTRLS